MPRSDFILTIGKQWITGHLGTGSTVKVGRTLVGFADHVIEQEDGSVKIYIVIDPDITVSREN